MKKKNRANSKFPLVYVLFFLSSIAMLIAVIIFSYFIDDIEKERINSIQNHLRVAAQRASTYLTVEELDLFHTAEDMERPEWEEIRTRLKRFAEETSVLYVYYWRYDGGDYIQYIIDNDEDEEYMVTPDLFFALKDDPFTADAVLKIQAGESWVTELGVYTSSWDGLLAAVVPVFNDDGTIYCAAGVDISDEIFINMRNNIDMMEFVLLFSLFTSVLSGFFGIRSYRKKAIQSDNDSLSKSQFLSTMSHEMRTPLNAIIGMTAIGKKAEDLDKKDRAFKKIEDASSHMLGVINDVLDMAKIEANKLELSPIEYNFDKMLKKVITVVSFRAEEKKQALTVNIENTVPKFIFGDDQHLAQVITNLLSNAIKFTPENGKIKLSVSLEGVSGSECELRIEVADNGIGIANEQQKKLFKMFEQAEDGTTRKFGGTGLGLAISKRIVELMGGRIWVESELGKGARFIFTIKALYVEKTIDYTKSSLDPDGIQAENIKAMGGRFSGKRMLIAEDIEINREILISLLENTGLVIDSAENGEEALNMVTADTDKYDIIFMDIQMPIMDGLEATRRIRALPARERGRIPIIAITANAYKDDINSCIEAGMDDHLSKPLDVEKIFAMLSNHLK
ncbi:MAG: ATP-binding protein [Treponema sp.]|nr:ATP-binding protein [Treponema sp.]